MSDFVVWLILAVIFCAGIGFGWMLRDLQQDRKNADVAAKEVAVGETEARMTETEQLQPIRNMIYAMVNALGADLPRTPEVCAALDALLKSDMEST